MPTKSDSEWAEEYRQANEEFEKMREQWERELQEHNKRRDSRPTQEDILEELEEDWPTVKPLAIEHQIIAMMNDRIEIYYKRMLDIRSTRTVDQDTEFGVSGDDSYTQSFGLS